MDDFNNNLFDNLLIGPMLSLHLHPVNMSIPTHFHSTSSSLIDLVFVNHEERVLLHDQISLSCFSNHDLIFLNYNMPITSVVGRYITYRDFKNIDYVSLNTELDNIHCGQVFTLGNANDQLLLIQENVRRLYDNRGFLRK